VFHRVRGGFADGQQNGIAIVLADDHCIDGGHAEEAQACGALVELASLLRGAFEALPGEDGIFRRVR